MDDKIMLNDEELNKVSGGNYEDLYGDYTKRKAANRKEVESIIRDHKCPCCQYNLRPANSLWVCKSCRIVWRAL